MAYWLSRKPSSPASQARRSPCWATRGSSTAAPWATRSNQVYPSATVVNVGVGGNRTTHMLARFDTDVPADSDYVIINEPSVNDLLDGGFDLDIRKSLSVLAQIIAKCYAIGAIPIVVGAVPFDLPNKAVLLQDRLTAASRGDWAGAPDPDVNVDTNSARGFRCAARDAFRSGDTAYGFEAQEL